MTLCRWLVSISLIGIAPSLEGHEVRRDIIKFLSKGYTGVVFTGFFLAQKFSPEGVLEQNSSARKFLNIGISNCA